MEERAEERAEEQVPVSEQEVELDVKFLTPRVRKRVLQWLAEGKSAEEIAKRKGLPVGAVRILSRISESDVKDELALNTKVLLSYIPDSIEIIADVIRGYWNDDCISPQQKKLCVDVAKDVLKTVGLMSSDTPSYQVNNYIQNNFSADIKVIAAEWKNRLDEMKDMVKSIYGQVDSRELT